MNILGFNPSHHSSVCLLQEGEIKYFIQEERLTRKKYDGTPFKSFIYILQNYKIDYICWATPSLKYPYSNIAEDEPHFYELALKYHPKVSYADFSSYHHLAHTGNTFYNSGFKKSISVVIDGLGSGIKRWGQETESIYTCEYPSKFNLIYKNLFSDTPVKKDYTGDLGNNFNISENINLARVYETVTMHLGWTRDEAGKLMGLSSYGAENPSFPNFFSQNNGRSDIFYQDENRPNEYLERGLQHTFINTYLHPELKLKNNPKEWHYDKSKITSLEKDLAWKVQNDTQQIVGDYIEKAIKETGLKQVCCSGGYFLNCVANYYLEKRFPDVEFYFDPIAYDAGTAIGVAKLLWHDFSQDTRIRPLKSLYLGKQYSKKQLKKSLKKYK